MKIWKRTAGWALAGVLLLGAAPVRAAEIAPADAWLIGGLESDACLFAETGELDPLYPGVWRTENRALAEHLLRRGAAEYVEPDLQAELLAEESPAEPFWSYRSMGAGEAAALGLDGGGIRIALIDSGVDSTNPNLQGAKLLEGKNYSTGGPGNEDLLGHGTCVAQVCAGIGDQGAVTGIAPGAELLPLRCFGDQDSGTISLLAQAIREAVDVYHCDVINMSWGLAQDSQALRDAVAYAAEAGVVLVAAAGNVNRDFPQGTPLYPAAYPDVVGVGSLLKDGTVSNTSQQTEAVDLSAPGGNLHFRRTGEEGVFPSSGTSFASPAVAAASALLLQASPGLTAADLEAAMQERSDDRGQPGYDTAYGAGALRLDWLLRESWCRIVEGPAGLEARGWFRSTDGGALAAAQYRSGGKMLNCRTVWFEGPLVPVGQILSTMGESVDSVRLFFLDRIGVPIARPAAFSKNIQTQKTTLSE